MNAAATALPSRTRVALLAGDAVARLSRVLARGRGSVIGGKVALRIDPRALEEVARDRCIALVTGTNGKSTTTELLATAAATAAPVASNDLGSNMEEGILTALWQQPAARLAVLEVDEAYLGPVARSTRASVIVLMNLSREYTRGVTMAKTERHWRQTLAALDWPCTVVANVDDPNVAWAAEAARDVLPVSAGLLWSADAVVCARCGDRLRWDGPQWSCPGCGRARPQPVWWADADGFHGPDGVVGVDLQLPGQGTRSGALLAVAAATAMGADAGAAGAALSAVRSVDGRYVPFPLGADHEVSLLLVKNPAGWAQMVDLAGDDAAPMVFAIEPWGVKDTATMWDAPVERLAGRTFYASGQRRLDVAQWLAVGGAHPEVVADPLDAVRRCSAGRVDVVCNYSSFKALRRRLST